MSGRRCRPRAIDACGAAFVASRRKQVSFAVLVSLLVVAMTVLAGCGQKGPLVLPDRDASAPATTSSSGAEDDEEERTGNGDRNGTENGADGR